MITHINESGGTRRRDLAEQILRFRDEPIETMREVAMSSAGGIKSLKAPIRAFAHSGVKLATVSQSAAQNLIELESEVITSALTAAAMRLERAALPQRHWTCSAKLQPVGGMQPRAKQMREPRLERSTTRERLVRLIWRRSAARTCAPRT